MRSSTVGLLRWGLMACLVLGLTRPAESVAGSCDEPAAEPYRRAMMNARNAIEREDYQAALEYFRQANARYDYAILEFSMARALHRLEQQELAIESYTRFLARFEGCPDPDELTRTARDFRSMAIQELIEQEALNAQLALETLEPEDGAEEEEPTHAHGLHPGWWVLSGGLALIGAGAIHDLANLSLLDDLEEARRSQDVVEFDRLAARAENHRVADWVLFGVGSVALVGGVLLLLLLDDELPSREPAVEVGGWRLGIGWGQVSWVPAYN